MAQLQHPARKRSFGTSDMDIKGRLLDPILFRIANRLLGSLREQRAMSAYFGSPVPCQHQPAS